MDHAMNLHLSHSRYSRLIGEIGTLEAIKGGALKITLSNSVEKLDSTVVVRIEIDALAVPKGSNDLKKYAFKLAITVEGIYEGDMPADFSFENEEFRLQLSQPLYTMGVIELRDLAQKLGFSNIQFPWDITVLSLKAEEDNSVVPVAAKTKRIPKVVAKKTSERK